MELFLPLMIILLAGMMFMSMRKQKKMAQQTKEMQDALQAGARVQTTSGIYGTVVDSTEYKIDLEIAPGVVTRWNKQAVREVVHEDDVAATFPGAPETSLVDGSHEAIEDETAATDDRPATTDASENTTPGETIDPQGNGSKDDPDTNNRDK